MDEVLKIFELKGIKGLSGLSQEEQSQWRSNPEIKRKMAKFKNASPTQYAEIEDRIYRNQLFREEFNNEELLQSMSPTDRDALYKKTVLNKYINNAYKDDPNLNSILNMTPEGQLDLLESKYLNPQDKEETIRKKAEASAASPIEYSNIQETRFGDMSSVNALNWNLIPEDIKERKIEDTLPGVTNEVNKKQKEILEAYIKKDSNRRIEQAKPEAQYYRDTIHKSLDNREINELELDLELEKTLNMSPYYKAFKGTYVFKDLSINKKLEIVSNFKAVLQNAGNSEDGIMAAYTALNNQLQDYISDHQTTQDKLGNSLTNATLYGTTAHIMNSMLAFKGFYIGLTEGAEGYNKFMQGLDSEGNTVEDVWNPLYWQGVDQFNTFDLDEINKARLNGGIHKSQNITRSGEELNLMSFNTILEIIKQSKYMNAALLEALALKGVGKLLGGLGEAAGIVGKSSKLDKAFDVAGAITEFGVQSAGQSQMEALSAYQEAVETNFQRINQLIDNEVEQQMLSYVKSKDWDKEVEEQKNILKKQLYEQLKQKYGERANDYILTALDEKQIEEQAIAQVNQNKRDAIKNQVSNKYIKDREEAKVNAAEGAMTTATVQGVKSAVTNGLFKKLIFSKKTQETVGLNDPNITVRRGADGLLQGELTKWEEYGRPLLNALGEGVDEFADGYISKLGQGFAVSGFEDYLKHKYDPRHYVEGMDNVLGHFLGGFNAAKESFYDPANYYEGAIGMFSSVGLNVNFGGIASVGKQYFKNLKDNAESGLSFTQRSKQALSDAINKDSQGNELTLIEKLNKVATNAIIDDISTVRSKYRGVTSEIDRINNILKNNKESIDKAFELIGSLQQTESTEATKGIIDNLDRKFANSFSLISILESLSVSPLASEIEQYQTIIQTLNRLAEGKATDEEIATFLGLPDNKSVNSKPNAREYAIKQLQENAAAFKQRQEDFRSALAEINTNEETTALSPDHQSQLLYYKLAKKDWERRRDKMAEELGITINSTDSRDVRSYGNKKVIQNQLSGIQSRIQELNSLIKDNSIKIEELENKSAITEEVSQTLERLKYENSISNNELTNLQSETEYLNSILNQDIDESLLSAQGILSLDPTQMAFMLDPKNRREFSKEQLRIIDDLVNTLKIKDPSALKKIRDIATLNDRVKQVDAVYSKSLDNPQLVTTYINGLQRARAYAVQKYYEAKVFNTIKEHLKSLGDDKNAITSYASNLPVSTIDRFIKANPEYKDIIQVGRDLATLKEDIKFIIDNITEDEDFRTILKQIIVENTESSQSLEEAIEVINNIASSESVDDATRLVFKSILDRLETNKETRVATKVRSIKEEKNRAEELRREREELEEKEEEAKEAIENESSEEELSENNVEEKESTEEDLESLQESFENPIELTEEEVNMVISPDLESMQDSEHQVEDTTISIEPEVIEDNYEQTTDNEEDIEYLKGNVIIPYDSTQLSYRTLAPRVDEYESTRNFLSWIKSMGIDYQFIIDNELHLIAKLNPKIHFLTVNPKDNATHDNYLQNYALSVVEYTSEIERIHKKERGGILEANGKKWLVIGIIGGRNKVDTAKFKKTTLNMLKIRRRAYFDANPKERFFVDPNSYTFIRSIQSGRRVFRNSPNDSKEQRSILDILNDPSRNPQGKTLESLMWGIQQFSKFLPVNFSNSTPHSVPKDIETNAGRLFMMLPNADGVLFPVAMQFTSFKNINKNSEYYNKLILPLIRDIINPDYSTRLKAIRKLCNYIHFDDKANILIGREGENIISFVDASIVGKSFDISSVDFKFDEFLREFEKIDFLINFTPQNLNNEVELRMMAEAGVITTDFATLNDHGASFTIYNIDSNGNPIIRNSNNIVETNSRNVSDYNRVQRKSINYDLITYRVNNDGSVVDINGNIVTNDDLIENIKIALDIQYNNKVSVATRGEWSYYILNKDKNNPKVVKMHGRRKTIITATKEEAIKTIEKFEQDTLNRLREENAKRALEQQNIEVIEEASSEDVTYYNNILTESKEDTELAVEEQPTNNSAPIEEPDNSYNLNDVFNNLEYMDRLLSIINEKSKKDPSWNIDDQSTIDDVKVLLNKKNIHTEGIVDIDVWLQEIEDCG